MTRDSPAGACPSAPACRSQLTRKKYHLSERAKGAPLASSKPAGMCPSRDCALGQLHPQPRARVSACRRCGRRAWMPS